MAIQTVAPAPSARLNRQGRAIFALRERYVKCKSNRQQEVGAGGVPDLGYDTSGSCKAFLLVKGMKYRQKVVWLKFEPKQNQEVYCHVAACADPDDQFNSPVVMNRTAAPQAGSSSGCSAGAAQPPAGSANADPQQGQPLKRVSRRILPGGNHLHRMLAPN